MANISRLKSAEISNGNYVNADDVEAELDQLVTEHNSKETRIVALESGNTSISGNKTFTGTTTLSGDVNVGGSATLAVANKLNIARSGDPGTLADGDLWYETGSDLLKVRTNGATVSLNAAGAPKYVYGPAPQYNAAPSIILPAGLGVIDDTNTVSYAAATNLTVSLATSGANGLDTGTEASNTWYYVWLIRNTSGTVAGLFSTSSTSPTMPSGYTQKARLPFAVRNDGSSNIIPFVVESGWPDQTIVRYITSPTYIASGTVLTLGTNNVINAGTTGGTGVSLASFCPPISRTAICAIACGGGSNGHFRIREGGTTVYPYAFGTQHGSSSATILETEERTFRISSTQTIDWTRDLGTGTFFLDVQGFVVTEL